MKLTVTLFFKDRIKLCLSKLTCHFHHLSKQGQGHFQNNVFVFPSLREYNWNVKSKASKGYEENFFFVVRNGGIFYNELETRVRLSKRRLKAGQQPSNSKLVVRHRPLSKQELKMQRYRWVRVADSKFDLCK